jgi:cell division protein FtsW (lipid II flippase)
MKRLRNSATVNVIFGFLSLLALLFLYLALVDIAHGEPDLVLEWRVVGVCLLILFSFTISTFVTLGFLLKKPGLWNGDQ